MTKNSNFGISLDVKITEKLIISNSTWQMHRLILIIQFLIYYSETPVEQKEMPQNLKFSKAEINDYIDDLVKEIKGANSEFVQVDPELPGNIWFNLPASL